MSKKTCFMIFVIAVIAIIAAFILKIGAVTSEVEAVFAAMKNPYVAGAAVILALLLNKQKHYWLLMLGCALIAAVAIQLLFGGAFALWPIAYKAIAFMVYVYLIALIRFMW